jgi:hypothetical protein
MHRSPHQDIDAHSNTTSLHQPGRFCVRREADLGTRRNRPIGPYLPMDVSGFRRVEMARLLLSPLGLCERAARVVPVDERRAVAQRTVVA